eukprot:bmy_05923T0
MGKEAPGLCTCSREESKEIRAGQVVLKAMTQDTCCGRENQNLESRCDKFLQKDIFEVESFDWELMESLTCCAFEGSSFRDDWAYKGQFEKQQIIYKLQSVHGPDTASGNARIKRMKELNS